jgi:hypothetical protein
VFYEDVRSAVVFDVKHLWAGGLTLSVSSTEIPIHDDVHFVHASPGTAVSEPAAGM